MPSFPVHLAVADMLGDELSIVSKPDFFLGCIAPDSVNLTGFASQELRYGAHIRSVDYDNWKKQLTEFYRMNNDRFKDKADYLKGYVFHCITDIAWDEAVQPQLFAYLQRDGKLDREQITKLKWEELFRFNSLVMGLDSFKNAVCLLDKAEPADIATVSAQQVEQYRDYVVNDYKDKISAQAPGFLCLAHISACAQRTRELYRELIE